MNNTILAGAPVGNKNAAGKRKFLHPEIAQRHALEDHEVAAATKYLKGERTSAEFDRLSATVSQAIDDHEHFERTGTMKASEAQEDNVVRAAGTSEGVKKSWETRHTQGLEESNVQIKAWTATDHAHRHSMDAWRSGDKKTHREAAEKHTAAAEAHEAAGNKDQARYHRGTAPNHRMQGYEAAQASDATSTEVIHCRASSAAGEKLGASEPWKPGEQVTFMWMPAGVSTICAGFRKGSIELTVNCDEATAEAVQASLENWRNDRPKQEPFGCVEHREQEASFRISASGGFKWNGDGVYLAAEPTTLGAQNVNGKVHRSWSPSFTTDADYSKATERDGVLQFPEGVRGSRSNPAQITGVDFCVGTLTNKPAFHSMSPVRSREAVMASGTSEGAKKGWEEKHKLHLHMSDRNSATAAAYTASAQAHEASAEAHRTGDKDWHDIARTRHRQAEHLHKKTGNDSMAMMHQSVAEEHEKPSAKAFDTVPSDTITAHCKENLLRDVPDATKAEIAQYEKLIDEGGSHGDAVYEIRKDRKNGFVSSAEKPTLDSIYGKVNASLTTANRLAEENGVCKLTAADVYERHSVRAGGTSEGAKKGWQNRHGLTQDAERASAKAWETGDLAHHEAAKEAHSKAAYAHSVADDYDNLKKHQEARKQHTIAIGRIKSGHSRDTSERMFWKKTA